MFHEILLSLGVDSRADVRRYLERGEPLAPAEAAFAPTHRLEFRRAPGFDPGLRIASLLEDGRVAGIVRGGVAERAGLRDGMVVTRTENGAPWTGRWDPQAPMVLLVGDGGEPRRVEVDATAGEIQIPIFRGVAR